MNRSKSKNPYVSSGDAALQKEHLQVVLVSVARYVHMAVAKCFQLTFQPRKCRSLGGKTLLALIKHYHAT